MAGGGESSWNIHYVNNGGDDQEHKKIKLNPQQAGPLGLKLQRTSSFLSVIQSTFINKEKQLAIATPPLPAEKFKAANFHCVSLEIGSWKWVSKNPGDLVGKIYFSKKKIVWEILSGALKKKMEISWSVVSAIKAYVNHGENDHLLIELNEPPEFGQEINLQKGKHTQWTTTTDFTENQALIFRRHIIECLPGVINKHFENLMKRDQRLLHLSRQPFPIYNSPFFLMETRCLNFSQNHNFDVGCSSSVPDANFDQQALLCCVQNIAPPISPLVPSFGYGSPSSDGKKRRVMVSQEVQITGSIFEVEQRRSISSIDHNIEEQNSLLQHELESWMQVDPLLPPLQSLNIRDHNQHYFRYNPTTEAFKQNYMKSNGFAIKEYNPALEEARMNDFGSCSNATNHIDNQMASLKVLEEVDDPRVVFAGQSSCLPPEKEFSISDLDVCGMNLIDYSGNNMIDHTTFDPSTGNGEENNILGQAAEGDKNGRTF